MGFRNPILGGTELVRDAIQSSDYVAGVSGWTINRDGSSEFNDGTFRGQLLVTNASGSQIRAFANGSLSEIDLQPPDSVTPGVTFNPAQIYAESPADMPLLVVLGPSPATPVLGGAGQLNLGADPVLGQTAAQVLAEQVVIGDTAAGSTTQVLSASIHDANNIPLMRGQAQSVSVSFVAQTSFLQPVVFPVPFPAGVVPSVIANVNSQLGVTNQYQVMATAITNVGFTLWIRITDAARAAQTWANVAVNYIAAIGV